MITFEQCTKGPQQCLPQAPDRGKLLNLTKPFCSGDEAYNVWYYWYETCMVERVDMTSAGQNLSCNCINNLFKDCSTVSNYGPCKVYLNSLVSMQIVAIILGLVLNITITAVFYKRPAVRKKVPNILLCNQAVADIFNCGVYGISNAMNLLFNLHAVDHYIKMYTPYIVFLSLPMTISSSVFMYLIIAMERFLSISHPLWHRVHVRKKRIWISIVTVWILSILMSTMCITCIIAQNCEFVVSVLLILLGVIVAVITMLFIITFIKAFQVINNPPTESNQDTESSSLRKQLRLTIVFFIMFAAFALVYIPLTVLLQIDAVDLVIPYTLLTLTSVLNPILTLSFKKELRPRNVSSHKRNNMNRHEI